MSIITDKDLLDGISREDKNSFKEFYLRYATYLFSFVFKKVKSEVIAEDLTQEFWLQVWEKPSFIKCNVEGSAKPFIVQQLRFRMIDNYRKTMNSPKYLEDSINDENLEWYYHVSEDLEVKEAVAIINEALETLPESTRKTFWMRINNITPEEIAKELSITVPTTYNKFSQSLKVVNSHIKEKYPEFAENFVKLSKDNPTSYSAQSIVIMAVIAELFK